MTRLDQIGERQLVDRFLAKRYAKVGYSFGDDCAFLLDTSEGAIVASTDPAPQPIAWELGFQDYYHWGWLLAACNLSDLGAVGAAPVGLLSSLTLPNRMDIEELGRFLDGLDTCCDKYACPVLGGNIKEGDTFRCEATVVGRTVGGHPISRRGAHVGDFVVAIGRSGYFWSAVLALTRGFELSSRDSEELVDAIVRPTPQVWFGNMVRTHGLAHASTDASDGLYYALYSLTVSQGLGFQLDSRQIVYPELVSKVAALAKVDPLRLMFGFGDMQLVFATPKENLERVQAEATTAGEKLVVLGVVTDTGRLELTNEEGTFELANFDNERLSNDSEFTAGLAAYEHRLLTHPLVKDLSAMLRQDVAM